MGDFLNKLLDLLLWVFRPENLVRAGGGSAFSGLSTLLLALGLYERQASPRTVLLLLPSTFIILLFFWWLLREGYFRLGTSRKIGIAYTGYRVSRDDWVETKDAVRSLFRDSPATRRVRIVHVPPRVVENEAAWERFQTRYGFVAVLKITVAAPINSGERTHFEATLHAAFRKSLRQDLLDRTASVVKSLFVSPETAPNLVQLIRVRAQGLFEPVLLFLALREVSEGFFHEGSRLLEYLDQRLAARAPPNTEPRRGVRWLRAIVLLQPSVFPQREPPIGDDLLHACALARIAFRECGDSVHPFVFHTAARTLYYCGEADEALKVTEKGLALTLPPVFRFLNMLNRGVLNLFAGNWNIAHDALQEALTHQYAGEMDWGHLIDFADMAEEMGEPNAVYLRCLYRGAKREPIDSNLLARASSWLGVEPSKQPLRYMLNRVIGGGARALPQAQGVPVPPGKSSKKNRRKRRK